MGNIRKRGNSWTAQVRIAGWRSFTKTFKKKTDAIAWSVHLENKHPINKGGFTIESNCILVCASCNGRKGALSLRAFCKEADLDFEKVVTRLEVLGKHV